MLRNKKLAIAFLSVGAVATWVPALRSSENQVRNRAEPLAGEDSPRERATHAPDANADTATESRPDLPDVAITDGGQSERNLEAMASFLPTGSPSSLEDAAMAWANESSGQRGTGSIPERPLPDGRSQGASSGGGLLEEESVAYHLGDRPLTGILHSASGSLALLGGNIVREGDVLVRGVLTVDEIAASHVTLIYRGDRVRLSLPGFRAAPPAVYQAREPEPNPETTEERREETPESGSASIGEEDSL